MADDTFNEQQARTNILESLGFSTSTWEWRNAGSGTRATITDPGLKAKINTAIDNHIHNAFLNTEALDEQQLQNLRDQIIQTLDSASWNAEALTTNAAATANNITPPSREAPPIEYKTSAQRAAMDDANISMHLSQTIDALTEGDGRASFSVAGDGSITIDPGSRYEGQEDMVKAVMSAGLVDVLKAASVAGKVQLQGNLSDLPDRPGNGATPEDLKKYHEAVAAFISDNKEAITALKEGGVLTDDGKIDYGTVDDGKIRSGMLDGVAVGELASLDIQGGIVQGLKDLKDGDRTNDMAALNRLGITDQQLKDLGIDPSASFTTTKGSQVIRAAASQVLVAALQDGVLDEREISAFSDTVKAAVASIVQDGGLAAVQGGRDVSAAADVSASADQGVQALGQAHTAAKAAAER